MRYSVLLGYKETFDDRFVQGGFMIKAQRPIDPSKFSDIPRTKDLINRLPDEVRVCSEHGEAVAIMESDLSLNPGAGPPFGKAAYVACCDAAIEKLIDAIIKEAQRIATKRDAEHVVRPARG